MPIRNESFTGQPTDLTFQILKNGIAFIPFNTVKVEFYGTLTDAQNNTNLLSTTTSIIHLGNGVYQYQAPAQSVAKTYYDKFYFIDTNGNPQQSKISSFIVNDYELSTPEDTTNKVYVIGKILDNDSVPVKSAKITFTLANPTYIQGQNIILTSKPLKVRTNRFGEFGIFLYKLKSYDVKFENEFLKSYNKTITVPDIATPLNFENA